MSGMIYIKIKETPCKMSDLKVHWKRTFSYRNLLQWLSRIIDVFGPIITKLRFSGPISVHMLSSNKTNCVGDHKNLIIGQISWLFADYSRFSWLFSDYRDYSVIIDDYAWLFNTNHDYSPQIGWPLERMVNKQI